MESLVVNLARPTTLEAAAGAWREGRALTCADDGARLALSAGDGRWRRFQCTWCGASSHLFRVTSMGRFEVTPMKRFAEEL